jgi:hypothetical protein
VHRFWLVALDEERAVAVSLKQGAQLLARDAGEHRRVCDLVAVEVEHRQDGPVLGRVQELVGVPAGGQWPRLGLAVADDAAREQVRVVEHRAVGVHERIAELSSLVDRARGLRSHMAGYATRKGELSKQTSQALLIPTDMRVGLAIRALQVGVGHKSRTAVSRTCHVDRVEVVLLDHPVHVEIDEVEAGRGAPVAEEPRLDVLEAQRLAQERIGEQIDLADRKVVGRAPVGVHPLQLVGGKRLLDRRSCRDLAHDAPWLVPATP